MQKVKYGTWTKHDGTWHIRFSGECQPGDVIRVERASGSWSDETIETIVSTAGKVNICLPRKKEQKSTYAGPCAIHGCEPWDCGCGSGYSSYDAAEEGLG